MKITKKIIVTLLISIMIMSSMTMSFADSGTPITPISPLFTVEDSDVVTHENILKIQKEITKLEKLNKEVSEADVNKILKKLGLSNVDIMSFEEINQAYNEVRIPYKSSATSMESAIAMSSTTPMVGWVLQGRWEGTNTSSEFSITPFLYNASGTTLTQVAGYTRGYVEIYPGGWVKNVQRYSNETFIKPLFYRDLGLMYMPVYGFGAYYVNEFILHHDGQTVILPAASWNNGR